ncbi:MAG: carboxypeptidase-like regulatory domain-containing protein [Nitrososphaeria archaeon]
MQRARSPMDWLESAGLVLSIFLFVLSTSPCLPSASAQGLPFSVYGYVTDEQRPVEGAIVTVNSSIDQKSTTSLPNGAYAITGLSVTGPGDTLAVTASKGPKSGSASATAPDAPNMQIDVTVSGPLVVTKTAMVTSRVVVVVNVTLTSTTTEFDRGPVTTITETVLTTIDRSIVPLTTTVSLTTTKTVAVGGTATTPSSKGTTLAPWFSLLLVSAVFSLVATTLLVWGLDLVTINRSTAKEIHRRILRQLAKARKQLARFRAR